jgi:Ca2+/Na+ antiporter
VTFQILVVGMLVWAFHNKQADVSNVIVFLLMYVVYILVCAKSGALKDCKAVDMETMSESEMSHDDEASKLNPDDEHKADDGHHAHESLSRFCPPPTAPWDLFVWIISIPLMVIEFFIVFTIPDPDSPTWKPKHLKMGLALNILMSTLWIGTFVLFMIEWAVKAGELIGISPAVMGLTFCAAGTSVPDCMCSIIVARQGKGNMAISNVFGSNVFDILIAMAVPWGLRYAISGTHNKIKMEAEGFSTAIVILGLVMALYVTCVIVNKFKLTKTVGHIHLGAYACFVVYVFTSNMEVFKEVFGHKHHHFEAS